MGGVRLNLLNLVEISYGVCCPSNPKLPVESGVAPIAFLALVWPTDGSPVMDHLRVSDGCVPTAPVLVMSLPS